jgi:hypothetical protein
MADELGEWSLEVRTILENYMKGDITYENAIRELSIREGVQQARTLIEIAIAVGEDRAP